MTVGTGTPESTVTPDQVRQILAQGLDQLSPDGKRILVILPDHTRTGPIPLFFETFCELLSPRAKHLNFLIALGTHPPLGPDKMGPLLGMTAAQIDARFKNVQVHNHHWDDDSQLATLGTITAEQMSQITAGLMAEPVTVRQNKLVTTHDLVIVCGPVFPHEVWLQLYNIPARLIQICNYQSQL